MLIETCRINNQLWVAYLFAEDMMTYLFRSRCLSYISPFAYYQFRGNVRTVFTEDIGKLLNYYALNVPLNHLLVNGFLDTLKDKENFESFMRKLFEDLMEQSLNIHELLQTLAIISKICVYCCRNGDYSTADLTIYLVGEALNDRCLWSEGRIAFNDLPMLELVKQRMQAPAG